MKKIILLFLIYSIHTQVISQICIPLVSEGMTSLDFCSSTNSSYTSISCSGWEKAPTSFIVDLIANPRSSLRSCIGTTPTPQASEVYIANSEKIVFGQENSSFPNNRKIKITSLSPNGQDFIFSKANPTISINRECYINDSAFPGNDHSLTVIYAPGPSFGITLNNLEVGENYTLVFYQANGYTDSSITGVKESNAFWYVTFGNSQRRSPLTLQSKRTIWEKVEMVFRANSSTQKLGFAAVYNSVTSNSSDFTERTILIDGIFISKQGACDPKQCEDFSSFNPTTGKKYVLSAWVKEDINNVVSYEAPTIDIKLDGASVIGDGVKASGRIIDGWQLIQKDFEIETDVKNLEIDLKNMGINNVYFDDIRIHPFDGNMKSFVYDPDTQRLMAELDENNYATFYEYDNEGGLIRVKKETERGIKTIQETRSKTKLRPNADEF